MDHESEASVDVDYVVRDDVMSLSHQLSSNVATLGELCDKQHRLEEKLARLSDKLSSVENGLYDGEEYVDGIRGETRHIKAEMAVLSNNHTASRWLELRDDKRRVDKEIYAATTNDSLTLRLVDDKRRIRKEMMALKGSKTAQRYLELKVLSRQLRRDKKHFKRQLVKLYRNIDELETRISDITTRIQKCGRERRHVLSEVCI